MICNKCGKSNENGVNNCVYCGTPMPATSSLGGFADILRYSESAAPASPAARSQGVSSETLRAVLTKANRAARQASGARTFALVSFLVTVCVVLVSLVFNFMALDSVNTCKREIETLRESVAALSQDKTESADKTESEDKTEPEDKTETEDKTDLPAEDVGFACPECGKAVEKEGDTCAECTLKKAIDAKKLPVIDSASKEFGDSIKELNANIAVLNTGISGYMSANNNGGDYGISEGGGAQKALDKLRGCIDSINTSGEVTEDMIEDAYDAVEDFERLSFKEYYEGGKITFSHKLD